MSAGYEAAAALERLGDNAAAIEAYKRTIDLDPDFVPSYQRLAGLYAALDFAGRALWYRRRLARFSRFDSSSLYELAKAQMNLGLLHSSLRTYRRLLRLPAAYPMQGSDYLFTLLHDHRQTPAMLKAAHQEWFRRFCPFLPAPPNFPNFPAAHRKLRIGYLSGEFKATPTCYFLLPVLRAHDRRQCSVYCYHLAPEHDAVTEQFKSASDHWRAMQDRGHDAVRSAILADRIDILVDISGHFVPHALAVFQRRAAPIQVSYPAYPSTTGCAEIDYFITDRWTTPPPFERHYSEKSIYRLPSGYIVYQPPENLPDITPLPALANGYITFGLFQRPAKFNDPSWETFAAILRALPNSRLLVQHANRDLDEPASEIHESITQALTTRGVAAARLQFAGTRGVRGHLETLAQADIALDTFPYAGQTTTCASLSMAVPVLSLAGRTHASRVGCGLLNRLAMSDWVAASPREYVRIAVTKANHIGGLALLRSGLRRRFLESSICRPPLVVGELDHAFRAMWRQWCAAQHLTSNVECGVAR